MQDFWLINGFFLGLGLIYIIVSLIFIFSAKLRNISKRRSLSLRTINANLSNQKVGYNLLISGLIITATATLILIFGKSLNLMPSIAINLIVTLIAHLFHNPRLHDPRNNIDPTIIDSFQNVDLIENGLTGETRIEINTEMNVPNDPTEFVVADAPESGRQHSIEISPEIFAELIEISDDPAATVDEAIRWWLRRRIVVDNDSTSRKSLRSSESWRAQQQNWND
jgi:hypothetical protein